jgi:hypothetical protein
VRDGGGRRGEDRSGGEDREAGMHGTPS